MLFIIRPYWLDDQLHQKFQINQTKLMQQCVILCWNKQNDICQNAPIYTLLPICRYKEEDHIQYNNFSHLPYPTKSP